MIGLTGMTNRFNNNNNNKPDTVVINNNWDKEEKYVLSSIEEMKQLLKESHENFVELMKTVVVINSKFDQYNNFNERLAEFQALLLKQDKQMDELRSKVSFINARLGWIVGGIGFVVTVGFNLLASFVSSLWKG